jgi:hypothetical protein
VIVKPDMKPMGVNCSAYYRLGQLLGKPPPY